MQGDYTDGGGWSRLDATSARALADAAGATGRAGARVRVALALFATLRPDGTTRVGERTLAKSAGVGYQEARGAVRALERSGAVVRVGGGAPGAPVVRAFSWTAPAAAKTGGGGEACTECQGPTQWPS